MAYGLGNYLWFCADDEERARTGMLTVTFDESEPVGMSYAPARIVGSGIPEPMVGSDAEHASRSSRSSASARTFALRPADDGSQRSGSSP